MLVYAGIATLSIEIGQLGLNLSGLGRREVSIDDAWLNIAGSALGYAVIRLWSLLSSSAGAR